MLVLTWHKYVAIIILVKFRGTLQLATLQDIANKAGVSSSTVSRCLRADPSLVITPATRDRIFTIANELEYISRSKKASAAQANILIVHKDTHFLNQIDNAFYFAVRAGIESKCYQNNFQFSFVPLQFLHLYSHAIDGALIVGNFTQSQVDEILKLINTSNLVFVGQYNFYPERMDWITYNIRDAVTIALECLINKGLSEILYIGGRDQAEVPREYQKLYYFEQFLTANVNIKCVDIIFCEHGAENGYHTMNDWLNAGRPLPRAILISNDPIAIGVLKALYERKIRVPDDVAVISINGDSSGNYSSDRKSVV